MVQGNIRRVRRTHPHPWHSRLQLLGRAVSRTEALIMDAMRNGLVGRRGFLAHETETDAGSDQPPRQRPDRPPPLALPLLGLCAMLLSCNGQTSPTSPGNPTPMQPSFTVSDFVSAVTDGFNPASPSSGVAPAPSGGASVQASANSTVINGGSSQVRLTSPTTIQRVILFVDGVNGYYSLPIRFLSTSVTVIVTIAQDIPRDSFTLVYAAVDTSGRVGAYVGSPLRVTSVGTGQLQINLTWDTPADVDLHVVEPSGEEIWYGDRSSATGGTLDLDANAACASGPSSENVTWSGSPPRGAFSIRATYWSSCGVTRTNYVLTITDGSQRARIYRGTFTGAGTRGAAGSGREIVRYTR